MAIDLRRGVTARYRTVCFMAALALGAVFAVSMVIPMDNSLLKQAGLASAVIALVVLYHAVFAPDLRWRLDSDTVACTRKTVFGVRHREWPMSAVASIRVRTIDGDESPDTYYVEVRLTSGKRLRLPPYRRRGRADEIALEIEALRNPGAG